MIQIHHSDAYSLEGWATFYLEDILPHDTFTLHPDANPNFDVDAKCCEIKGGEVKSPVPVVDANLANSLSLVFLPVN